MDHHPPPGDFIHLPMLARLPPREQERLRAVSWTRCYPKGQILCTQDDPAEHLLILETGQLKASRHTPGGREVILGVHTPPVAFDKAALLTGGRHAATLTALGPVTVRYLPAAAFVELVDREPSVRKRVLAVLAGLVHTRTEQLTDLVALDVPARLAKWLTQHAVAGQESGRLVLTTRLPASQSDLAAELGTTRVTVNRILHGFQAAGWLTVHRDRITLHSPDALTARSNPSATEAIQSPGGS